MLAVLIEAKIGPMDDCKLDQHRKYSNGKHLPIKAAPVDYWGSTVSIGA